MKPDEINKTLDKCINDDCDNCLNTFGINTFGNCQKNLMINALNYINKLEGEIENYKHLDIILNTAVDTLAQKIKSEVIKEFAEKVKLKFYEEFDELIPSIMADEIDNLVKEMVGEK